MEPVIAASIALTIMKFQSLKGFQPKWNPPEKIGSIASNIVSIPKRVSAKVELAATSVQTFASGSFQSLKGFQPKWNQTALPALAYSAVFQSLKGFQPKWNQSKGRLGPIVASFNP